ncbi:Serine-aspartate repeat-containing protein F precursor [Maliponia aquimaris]|uniref:Serine-aspartate repeat-containing protein F n=1 Tax=Maliponia aquimaris TaxID=1673631 RepID=A0A238L8Q4_9RHOB|nr:SdrD B-like domain-containing protein [Maliponia aquimaris]SMX50696.1 Serine-aspartate repeat-containing protein F precursor [Maliponia aquimaris]
MHIFDDDGTYLQTINFHTSCSAPIAIGDQYGSVSLVGGALLDKGTGGLIEYGVSSGPGDAGVTYAIVGGADAALFQVDPATGEVSFINAPDYENPLDDGADNTYDVIVRCTKEDGSFEDTPLEVCIEDDPTDDPICIDENTTPVVDLNVTVECEEPKDLGLDLCMERDALRDAGVDAGKFAAVTLRLGDMLTTTSSTDQNGKLDVGAVQPGDDGDGIYHIRVSNKDNPNDTSEIYFDGTVAAGDSFTALASAAGRNEFGSETRVHIFDDDGTYLQTINFHTSCSAPIAIGDQYGSVSLVGGALLDKGTGGLIEYGGTFAAEANEPDIVYAIVGGADAALFRVDAATGEVSFIDPPDYENPLDEDRDNTYDVIVRATSLSDPDCVTETPIAICVEDVPEAGSLSGRYWCDDNRDGLDNDNEPGVQGVHVALLDSAGNPATDFDGNPVPSTLTAPDGSYSFGNLAPGTYSVKFTDTVSGKELTTQNVDGDVSDDIDSDAFDLGGGMSQIDGIVVVAEQDTPDNDAGVVKPLGALGDRVWFDTDRDGVQDDGETGVADVTVTLTGAGDDGVFGTGDDITAIRVTDGNGNYLFEDLEAGDYKVTFSDLPAGYVFTTLDAGPDDAIDSDAGAGGMTATVSLALGDINLTVDAGIVDPGTASLAGRYFCDENDNDIDDGEPGVPGVTVTLRTAGGALVSVTTTAPDGSYEFTGLVAGDYVVTFAADPTGKTFVTPNVGTDDTVDSDGVLNSDGTASTGIISLAIGARSDDNDVGVEYPNSPPEATPDTGKGCADTEIRVDLADNISDPDGDPVTITAVDGVALTDGGPAIDVGGVLVRLEGTELVFDGETAFASLDIGEEDTASFSYTIEDGNGGLATSMIDVTFCGDANSVEALCGSLPDGEITYRVQSSNIVLPVEDYAFNVQFVSTGDARFDGSTYFQAYCLDRGTPVGRAESFGSAPLNSATMLCASDPGAVAVLSGQISAYNGNAAVDNLDMVSWILNQDFENSGYTGWEVQRAIWELMDSDDLQFLDGVDPGFGSDAKVQEILDAAAVDASLGGGEGFVAGVGDVVGILLDPGDSDPANKQPFIVAVDWEDIDCLCTDNSGMIFL